MAVHLQYTVNLLHTNKCYHDLYLKCTSTNWPPKSTIPVYYYCAIVDCILKLHYVSTRISLYWKCTQSNRSEIPLYCFCTAWLLQHKNNIYKEEFHLWCHSHIIWKCLYCNLGKILCCWLSNKNIIQIQQLSTTMELCGLKE